MEHEPRFITKIRERLTERNCSMNGMMACPCNEKKVTGDMHCTVIFISHLADSPNDSPNYSKFEKKIRKYL